VSHPLVAGAARGELPGWAQAGPARREHIERVRVLLEEWAVAMELPAVERARWCAAGVLHDALRDAPPEELRPQVPPALRDLPASILHGPAVAERLRREGVSDRGLLRAVGFHTLGHPKLDDAGRALFAADVLEPGRKYRPEWRRKLRERFPRRPVEVTREVSRARIAWQLEDARPLHRHSMEFWNVLARDAPSAAGVEGP
jgi:HD superfamily phosphohydrolase YqeK